jgi:hypothetical protein
MQKFLTYDKLAREDRFIRMRVRRVAENRTQQGLLPFPDMRDVAVDASPAY